MCNAESPGLTLRKCERKERRIKGKKRKTETRDERRYLFFYLLPRCNIVAHTTGRREDAKTEPRAKLELSDASPFTIKNDDLVVNKTRQLEPLRERASTRYDISMCNVSFHVCISCRYTHTLAVPSACLRKFFVFLTFAYRENLYCHHQRHRRQQKNSYSTRLSIKVLSLKMTQESFDQK